MSRDQAKQMLITFGIENPTDEQITNYLNSVNGEVQKEKSKTDANKAELERLKKIEQEFEENKNASLTAEQKLQAALEAAEATKKEFSKRTNKLEVEKLLIGAGLTSEDYADYIDLLISEDSETSTKLANGLVATLKKQKEATEKAVKADLLKNTPTPDGGSEGGETKTEDIKLAETLVASMTGTSKESQDALNFYTQNGGNK